MAVLQIKNVSEEIVQAYGVASLEEQKRVREIIEGVIVLWSRNEKQDKSVQEKSPLLQKGTGGPLRPFKAITMKGEGPTASEMVIQDRY